MSDIKISIITACYNHGKYIDEAVNSIKSHNWSFPIEHIIINDGSDDLETIKKLANLKDTGLTIINQQNRGPASARNNGIRISKGKYILPFDADNILRPTTIERAVSIMENDNEISVVYTNAWCFGENEYCWKPGKLDPDKLLSSNYIDACALIKKEDFVEVGGYDENIPFRGNEDWDLWLNLVLNKKVFYYLQDIGFEYRVLNNSLSKTESTPNQASINKYIVKKYATFYALYFSILFNEKNKYDNLKKFLTKEKLKSIVKILMNKPLINY